MKEWLRDVAIVFAILFAVFLGLFFLLRDDEPLPNISKEQFDTTFETDTQQKETNYKEFLLDNYLIEIPKEPVTFEFESNGDGTCTIIDYSVNADPEKVVQIDLPSTSPDGEKVTRVNVIETNRYGNVPRFMSLDMYELVLATLQQNGVSRFESTKIREQYKLVDLEAELAGIEDKTEREKAKQNFLSKYPFAEIMSAYVLLDNTKTSDLASLSKIFTTKAKYEQRDYMTFYNKTIREAVEHEKVTYAILNSIPKPDIGVYGIPTSATIPEGVTCIDSFNISTVKTLKLPESLVEIGEFAFRNMIFEGIELPSRLKKIGESAFMECYSLKNITIPSGVTELRRSVFEDCQSLEEVTLSDNLTTIASRAFLDCSSLKEITLPKSITNIGTEAFYPIMHIINYEGTVAEWKAFSSNSENEGWDIGISNYTVYCTDGMIANGEPSDKTD